MTEERRVRNIAAQSGGWIEVRKGEVVSIFDVDGEQVADTFAVSKSEFSEYLSVAHTRALNQRLFPRQGEAFYTNLMRPILTLLADTSPGVHDMLWVSCNPNLYNALGADADHKNCHDNFIAAAREFGWSPSEVPDPVNLFQNTRVLDDGRIVTSRALSKAGDHVDLRAEMDLMLVVTACAFDLVPINGDRCTGIRLEVGSEGPTEAAPARR